jgi:hypothetical protein
MREFSIGSPNQERDVGGCTPKLFLVRAIMKVVRNTVEGVRFTITTMVCSVLVAVWH